MGEMFRGCKFLKEIDLSGFNTTAVIDEAWNGAGRDIYYTYGNQENGYHSMSKIFMDCTNLKKVQVGIKWTTINKSTWNMFDNCGVKAVTIS